MSRGISWQQRNMLRSLAKNKEVVVAWRDVDDYNTPADLDDYFSARATWNWEQTRRRALRSLEVRGLVELGRYVFSPEPVMGGISAHIVWTVVDPDHHRPGESRIMTGVRLTVLGREAAMSL